MLSIGQSASAIIEAKPKWNDTGIGVAAGEEYQFTAVGTWTDWKIPCDADGYSSWLFWPVEWLRRAPRENWFALMGAVNCDERNLFKIGTKQTIRMKKSGTLTCFANDLPCMYWNNKGSVQLTITRTR